jgi:hypothetical protein
MRVWAAVICVAGVVAGPGGAAAGGPEQAQRPATLRVRAVLIDGQSNRRPVARHVMHLDEVPSKATPQRVDLDFEGLAELSLPAGKYLLQSERAVEFQGRTYRWRVPVDLKSGETVVLELTGDNATVEASGQAPGGETVGFFGDWNGKYAGLTATLSIDRRESRVYHGTLYVVAKRGAPSTEVQVEVTLNGRDVVITEMKVTRLGAVREWNLGTSSGTLSADSRDMSGGGKDSAGTPYTWSFARK